MFKTEVWFELSSSYEPLEGLNGEVQCVEWTLLGSLLKNDNMIMTGSDSRVRNLVVRLNYQLCQKSDS